MNELEEYLEGKKETCKNKIDDLSPEIVRIGECKSDFLNILLIAPPLTIPSFVQKRCVPPFSVLYLASCLELYNHNVSIIDCCQEGYDHEVVNGDFITYGLSKNSLRQRLLDIEKPDIVGISVPLSIDMTTTIGIASIVKEELPDTTIIIGGLHPTIYPKDVFDIDKENCVDYVIRGEGEVRIVEFVEHFKEGCIDKNMHGLVGNVCGEFVCNPQIDRLEDLDLIPFPAYHLLPMERYFDINMPFSPVPKGNRVMSILTTRGCPIGCSFCASTNMYRKHNYRSAENVIKEIKYLKEKYNIDEIQFADDNIIFNKSRFKEIIEKVKDLKLHWCTPNGVMINSLTPQFIKEMQKTGLYQITLSVDSANATNVMENFRHKSVIIEKVPSLIEASEECGVFTHGTIVVGIPGETLESIKKGLDFILEELHFTSVSTFIVSPIPGSEFYHICLERGFIKDKHEAWMTNLSDMMMLTDINGPDLEMVVRDFQNEFTDRVRERIPDIYNEKYKRLIEKGLIEKSITHGERIT